jgi:hypothetical protein
VSAGLLQSDDYFPSTGSYIIQRGISFQGVAVSKLLLLILIVFCFSFSAQGSEGEGKALERLAITTDLLVSIGAEMAGQPVSGLLTLGDTVCVDVNLSSVYSYQFVIWTDSAFNFVDFWLTSPFGDTPRGDVSDHTTLTIVPDSTETGTWQIGMELLEGAYSDSAYYAAAVFRNTRIQQ